MSLLLAIQPKPAAGSVDLVPQPPRAITAVLCSIVLGTALVLSQATPQAAPFAQNTWVNPTAAASSIALRAHLQSLNLTLLGQDQMFGASGQGVALVWPLPARGGLPRFEASSGNLLLTTLAVPFAQNNWPLPRPAVLALRTSDPNLLALTVASSAAPFAQNDWPTPQSRPASIALRTYVDTRKFYYVDQQPFALTDWPAPRSASRIDVAVAASTNIVLNATVAAAPFSQNEWPLARAREAAAGLRTHLDTRKFYYVDLKPFAAADPLPVIVPATLRSLYSWTQDALQGPLTVAAAALPPSRPCDWPIVRANARVLDLHTLNAQEGPLGTVQPFTQTEWAISIARVPVVGLRNIVSGGILETTLAVVVPFTNDWPAPASRRYSVSLRSLVRSTLETPGLVVALVTTPAPAARAAVLSARGRLSTLMLRERMATLQARGRLTVLALRDRLAKIRNRNRVDGV